MGVKLIQKNNWLMKFRNWYFRKRVSSAGQRLFTFGSPFISGGNTITVGDDFRINEGCKLISREGAKIVIGNDVTLSAGVTVLSTGYDVSYWVENGVKQHLTMETYIGNHVWCCANSMIMGGVKITGEYVVIAAGAVVTRDIKESNCLYAGVPARLVKKYE